VLTYRPPMSPVTTLNKITSAATSFVAPRDGDLAACSFEMLCPSLMPCSGPETLRCANQHQPIREDWEHKLEVGVLVRGAYAGMSGIRPEGGAVGLQMAWSTVFAPAADQRRCRSNPADFAQVTPLTAPSGRIPLIPDQGPQWAALR
jgi:hypothetical protein